LKHFIYLRSWFLKVTIELLEILCFFMPSISQGYNNHRRYSTQTHSNVKCSDTHHTNSQ
jgi:hypothetical protein